MAGQNPKELCAVMCTTSWAEAYNVPNVANDYSAISAITVCNQGTTTDTFYLATTTHSGSVASANIKFNAVTLLPNETFTLKWGWMLQANYALFCKSTNGTCSFSASGIEYS